MIYLGIFIGYINVKIIIDCQLPVNEVKREFIAGRGSRSPLGTRKAWISPSSGYWPINADA